MNRVELRELRYDIACFRQDPPPWPWGNGPLDEYAQAMLDRLGAEKSQRDVLPAFKEVPRTRRLWTLKDCVQCEQTKRLHHRIAKRVRYHDDRARELLDAINAIPLFFEIC